MSNQDCDKHLSEIIHSETNSRIYDRNIPSQVLQPYFTPRSVSTKYSIMPIVDPRKEMSVQTLTYPTYNTNRIFNPGNAQSPWSGYSSNVNKESELRNQIYALQKCSQAVYVPSSGSDLYEYDIIPRNMINNPFSELFREEKFDAFNPNPENLAHGLFLNSTRTQVKDIQTNSCYKDKDKDNEKDNDKKNLPVSNK
jgi:hypothetical protein